MATLDIARADFLWHGLIERDLGLQLFQQERPLRAAASGVRLEALRQTQWFMLLQEPHLSFASHQNLQFRAVRQTGLGIWSYPVAGFDE